MSHRLLAPADYRKMPWKNGGGVTWQIATAPPGASLDAFEWRVSIARIDRDGPFSAFPGIDRTLVLLSGKGMNLTAGGNATDVRVPYHPVRFAGEAEIECALVDGPTRDFNLMVRRGAGACDVHVVRDERATMPPASAFVCYSAAGACECLLAGAPPVEVACEHALVVEGADVALRVNPVSRDAVMLVAAIGAAR